MNEKAVTGSESLSLNASQLTGDNSTSELRQEAKMKTHNITQEVFPDREFPNEWHVETINGDTGDIFVALFSGPDAEGRAREYAVWQETKHESRQPVAA